MISRNIEATEQLKFLMNGSFNVEAAMILVRLGADPNTKASNNGYSLLHFLSTIENNANGKNNAAIEELVKTYHANIDSQDANGLTPLQHLMNGSFNVEAAMILVRLGADPNTKASNNGYSLLHFLSTIENNANGKNNAAIEELVKTYHANIDSQDANGLTPLQHLMNASFNVKAAMTLVRLGADPNTKASNNGYSLLHFLSTIENNANGKNNAAIEELNELAIKLYKKKYYPSRNNFLNLLILLTNDRNNELSSSFFKNLPLEIVLHIVSFLDFNEMGKTQEECYFLACTILSQPQTIKEMAAAPGGINVSQQNNNETNQPTFKFFKHTLEKPESDLKKNQKHKHSILEDRKST